MHLRTLAAAAGMTLGVQLIPGYWQVKGDSVVPNPYYQPKTGFQTKTGTAKTGSTKTSSGGSGTSGTSGGTSGASGGSGGGSTSGGGTVFGNGGGSSGGGVGGGLTGLCGPIQASTDNRGIAGATWETNLNDALPYSWARKFWLCGCDDFTLEGTGLYWQSRPIVMCMF